MTESQAPSIFGIPIQVDRRCPRGKIYLSTKGYVVPPRTPRDQAMGEACELLLRSLIEAGVGQFCGAPILRRGE